MGTTSHQRRDPHSGDIFATTRGILIGSSAKFGSTATGIAVTGPTFTGGIEQYRHDFFAANDSAGILVGGTTASGGPDTLSFGGGITNRGTISAGTGGSTRGHIDLHRRHYQ